MTWNEDRVELLKKLWKEGVSCTNIAKRITGDFRLNEELTRNAVIGKVRRLNLPRRKESPNAAPETGIYYKPSPPRDFSKKAPEGAVVVDFPLARKYLTETPEEQRCREGVHLCQWPIPCTLERDGRKPYCREHNSVAFQSASEKQEENGQGATEVPQAYH